MDWARFRLSLLRWYRLKHRAMPWRQASGKLAEPYTVLVSETMLQQTQVTTVIPYFHRFMARFPTIHSLAAAQEQQVLALWQGLGYYRRARGLHAAARAIVAAHDGQVPRTVESLLELPGVGRYTAGAIASIAFGVPAPVVDGNVARVLARVGGDARPVDQRDAVKAFWDVMTSLVRVRGRSRPGDVNQAVMELGATVCLPRAPRCVDCPVRRMCAAYATGEPERFGAKDQRSMPVAVTHRVVAVHREGRWLFERRGDDGLWARMWQFPTVESINGGSPKRIASAVRQQTGLTVGPIRRLADFTHVTTHRRISFQVCTAAARSGRAHPSTRWRTLANLTDLPMSRAQQRVVEMLRTVDPPAPGCDTLRA